MKRLHTVSVILCILSAAALYSCGKDEHIPSVVPVKQTYWNLSVGDIPALTAGRDTTISVAIEADVPVEELAATASAPWIDVRIEGGALLVHVTDNDTEAAREGSVTVSDTRANRAKAVTTKVRQDCMDRTVTNREGMVPFKDWYFKKACLEIADTDHDGDVSPEEAEAITELIVPGKRIKDISGIEAFRNVWKLDMGDNQIEDAMAITNLHYLHWLNLRGNKKLRCFDVRGCTSYFESCTFEVTEELDYYLYYRYMGIHAIDDVNCQHSHHSCDPRLTEDWSREGEVYEVYHHTEGPGKVGLVFSGIGWIDVDVNDGTFERIVHEAIEELKKQPEWAENWKYLDVYVMVHMAEKHGQWMYWNEKINCMGPEEYALDEAYNNHRIALWKQMENSVQNKYCFKFTIDNHANMMINAPVVDMDSWCHIIPNASFDHQYEGYAYNYGPISEKMKRPHFRIGNPNHPFQDEPTTWTDWLNFD